MRISDWSSNVCSSDLFPRRGGRRCAAAVRGDRRCDPGGVLAHLPGAEMAQRRTHAGSGGSSRRPFERSRIHRVPAADRRGPLAAGRNETVAWGHITARKHAEAAIALNGGLVSSLPLVIAYKTLFDITEQEGDTKAALELYKKYASAERGYREDVAAREMAYQVVRAQSLQQGKEKIGRASCRERVCQYV